MNNQVKIVSCFKVEKIIPKTSNVRCEYKRISFGLRNIGVLNDDRNETYDHKNLLLQSVSSKRNLQLVDDHLVSGNA